MSRILVIFGACAGLCYNALWYFPLLIAMGGTVTAIWDLWLRQKLVRLKRRLHERRRPPPPIREAEAGHDPSHAVELRTLPVDSPSTGLQRRTGGISSESANETPETVGQPKREDVAVVPVETAPSPATDMRSHGISIRTGTTIILAFFGMFPSSGFFKH